MAAVAVPLPPMSPSHSAPDEAPPVKMEEMPLKEALTPPASEENNGRARSNSDLSDLSMEDPANQDPIEPDHYYEGGKIPVFKPTMEQFKNFKAFIDKIDAYGMKSGIVKIIPPDEWRNDLPALDEMIKTIKVKNPIQQEFHGSQGTWTQANMEKQRTYNLPQWRALCEESNHQPPARRGERRRNQDTGRGTRPAAATTRVTKAATPAPSGKRGRGRPKKGPVPSIEETREQSQGPDSESQDPGTPGTSAPEAPKGKADTPSDDEKAPKTKGRQPKSVSSRRLRNKGEQSEVIDEESFKDFDYRINDQDQWTAERCKELETAYWKSLTFNNPMYGADMPGSLFDEEKTESWNVAKLPNLLDVLGQKVPGVNTAYLYLGMWKATFAWHLEDVDLYSINYIHFGAPKQWYSISQEDARRFEKAMQTIWPTDAKNCDQFLRHKTYLISPYLLKSQFNIEVNRLVHNEGEFVITYPYGYHSGYNLGYNCAESVNFANEAWLEYGKVARKCNCESDSVWVDVYDIERRLRGEKTPEYYETEVEEDYGDDEEDTGVLPTPPGSVKAAKPAAKKRKRDATDKGDKSKVKKIRIRISAPAKEPCCLCPHNPPYEPLLPTDTGNKAHRRCGSYTPETRIAKIDGVETICDVARIDKARLDLKCNHCRSKRGSVFQCSQKKCTRAYHATCGAAAGVQVDSGLVPVFLEDGSEYTEFGHDFRCRFHRVRRSKYNNDLQTCVNALEDDSLIRKTAKHLKHGDLIQVQYFLSDIFAGYVLENRRTDETLLVETYPTKETIEIEYKWILVLDPEQSQRPVPSPDAQPLPLHLLTSNKTMEDPASEVPKMDEDFATSSAFKWAEFHSGKPQNTEKLKVDLAKPKQLWHYLGPTSTEAKAQYTSDAANKQHDPSSNFLDSVRPPQQRPGPPRSSLGGPYPSGVNTNALNAVRASWNLQVPGGPQYHPHPQHYGPRPPQYPIDPRAYQQPTNRTHQQPGNIAGLHRGATVPDPMSAGMPMGRPDMVPQRRPSQPAVNVDGVRRWTQEAFQPLRPTPSGRPSLPALQPRQPPSQTAMTLADTMSPPSRPVFSRSPSAQPPPMKGNNLLTPPSTSDSNNGLRHRSDSLKALEKWPFIHESAAKRPGMYASPYANNGGYNESALIADVAVQLSPNPQMRSRSTSLMQDFLVKASPHQRELVRGHARHISTDKAVAKSREAERRMSESIQRQARLSGGNMSPIDMSEGLLGPDFGRPGSSSVISDRASPFPDFNNMNASTHTHPQPFQGVSAAPDLGSVNPGAIAQRRDKDTSGVSGLSSLFNLEATSLDQAIRISQPGRTLNRHQPDVYYSTADQFSAHLQQAATLYPMGTRPSSYNNYMRDLHHAATSDLHLRNTDENGAKGSKQEPGHRGAGEHGNSSFQPLHGHSVMSGMPSKSLVTPSDLKRVIEAERSNPARRASPPPAPVLSGTDNDIAVDDSLIDYDHGEQAQLTSPLKEGFGGGNTTLPVMDAFVSMN